MRKSILVLSVLGMLAPAASAASKPEDLYKKAVSEVVIPGFNELSVRGAEHAAAWSAYCAAPSEQGRDAVVQSFHAFADGWAAVEVMRAGPASKEFRNERLYFWPERKNAVERGLAALLKRAAASKLTADDIRAESAAVQGLPALERLLYPKGSEGHPQKTVSIDAAGCSAGEAISSNAARIAADMAQEWTALGDVADDSARTAFATDLVTAYAMIKDKKVEDVIGKSADAVKPHAAEFWRSGRAMRDIVVNLETLDRINTFLFKGASDEMAHPSTTRSALDIAKTLPPDLGALAAGKDRSSAILLRDAVDSAEDRAKAELPALLGVTVGFNSLDGD
jgi:predicted lipoprotein